jgi:hypothetical protein
MLLFAVTWLLGGCAATPPAGDAAPIVSEAPVPAAAVTPVVKPVESGKVVTDTMEKTIGAAVEDAAYRSGLPRESIKVISSARVTWRDGSLGCPEPGMMYTQALVPGYRILVQAGAQKYDYHAGLSGPPKFCPEGQATVPGAAADDGTR